MCSAPACHVGNVRPSIDSPHLAVISRSMPEYQCLWFQFYRASNFYCMAIAPESLSPSSPPSAADCWRRLSVAVALETSITAAVAVAVATTVASTAANSIITAAANAAAVNATKAPLPLPLPPRQETINDNTITTSKRASIISSAVKISLDERQRDNQPDKRHERGHWQQSSSSCSYATINNKKNKKNALVVSLGDGGVTAHLTASAPQL